MTRPRLTTALLLGLWLAHAVIPASADMQPLPSLQGSTGLWEAPDAQVLPDWHLRLTGVQAHPYRYYAAALGLFDCLEVHGLFTEVTTREGFPGEPYGDYKDRAAGIRLLLLRGGGPWPQLAVGAMDLGGTGLFASRYVVSTRTLGPLTLTVGLGQGVLGGESFFANPQEGDANPGNAKRFQTSSPLRRTRPFGGATLDVGALTGAAHGLYVVAEHTGIDHRRLFGQPDESSSPVNLGLKYRLPQPLEGLTAQTAWLRGRELSGGLSVDVPLEPQGLYAWRKPPEPEVPDRLRWQAFQAGNAELARLAADQLADEGFTDVRCRAADDTLWAEGGNGVGLSSARALARMARRLLALLPPRITRLSLALTTAGRVDVSLQSDREHLAAYLDSRLDEAGFLEYATLRSGAPYPSGDPDEITYRPPLWDPGPPKGQAPPPPPPPPPEWTTFPDSVSDWTEADRSTLGFVLEPKIRTFLNNREGFFKTKGLLRAAGSWRPDPGTLFGAEVETTLYNDYRDVAFQPQERNSVRTDLVLYERRNGTHITSLYYDEISALPFGFTARGALGWFEAAYAGLGVEAFRTFKNGRLGLGFEHEEVVKRSLDSPLGFSRNLEPYQTFFLNLYAQPWPEEGLDTGLKLGRFLAGDWGGRLEIRRTLRHITVGAWYTLTDTSIFQSPENRGAHDTGVFIAIPFGVFHDHEVPGRFRYTVSGFTRDAGQTVSQPRSLFPLSPEGTADHVVRELPEMRR